MASKFIFSWGNQNWQGGPVLAAKIGLGGPVLVVDRFFITDLLKSLIFLKHL